MESSDEGRSAQGWTLLWVVLRLMRQQWVEGSRGNALLKTHVADVLVDKEERAEAGMLYAGATETYEVFL